MEIISKKWARHENFVEQKSIKFEVFTKSSWIWYKLFCRKTHQNIGRNLYIDRYL